MPLALNRESNIGVQTSEFRMEGNLQTHRRTEGTTSAKTIEHEPRLALVLDAARTFAWDCDVATGRIRWWGNVEQLTTAGGFPGSLAGCVELVDPADRGQLESALAAALERRVPIDVELRLRRPDGTVRWVLTKGRMVYDDAGRPVRAVGVVIDIERHKRADEARAAEERSAFLARAGALQEANRIKDQFLAMVSHELRAPLQTMMTWAHVLEAGDVSAATRLRAIAGIQQSAGLQRRLVEDLVDVSRIDAGKLTLRFGPVDVAAVVESVADAIGPGAEAKGLALSVDVEEGRQQVAADADRLRQVVWNLLSNAVKFTPPGGRVDACARRVGAELEIVVSDTGEGIDPEVLAHVFEPFRQADSPHGAGRDGLGLGLAIVRHLVERHGGSVRAESAGIGRGATFTVRLPLDRGA
jgi:signal transduction histidine kinase